MRLNTDIDTDETECSYFKLNQTSPNGVRSLTRQAGLHRQRLLGSRSPSTSFDPFPLSLLKHTGANLSMNIVVRKINFSARSISRR